MVPGVAALIVHSQVTLVAPCCRKSVTTCRQAAIQTAGLVWCQPHEYQLAFISGANPITTGCPKARTLSAYARSS